MKQSQHSTYCSSPCLSLFSEDETENQEKLDSSPFSAQRKAIQNLNKTVHDIPAEYAALVMARNALSSFQCLIHANFLNVAKNYFYSMKRANKVVEGDTFDENTAMAEARRLVHTLIDTPNMLLERSARQQGLRNAALFNSTGSQKPCQVARSRLNFFLIEPLIPKECGSELPITCLMTTELKINGSSFLCRARCRGSLTVTGTVNKSYFVSLETGQFLASLRNQARMVVLQAVEKGLLKVPEEPAEGVLQAVYDLARPPREIRRGVVTPPPLRNKVPQNHFRGIKRRVDVISPSLDQASHKLLNCDSCAKHVYPNFLPIFPTL